MRLALLLVFIPWQLFAAQSVLIIADEFPAMEVLASKLKDEAHVQPRIITQAQMPGTLSGLDAVIVYIHGKLLTAAEKAFVDYAETGGKLILLHHSISSGKRTNALWFPFLGVSLPQTELAQGGYKWIEPADLEIVNLAPKHFITTTRVSYPQRAVYRSKTLQVEGVLPSFRLPESEVYLNHTLSGPRTVLLGFKYHDAKTGQIWMQDTAGWYKAAGKGSVFYFKPGHSVKDFENPSYARMLVNTLLFTVPSADGSSASSPP